MKIGNIENIPSRGEDSFSTNDETTVSGHDQGKRYLILIGMSTYKPDYGFKSLPNAVKDIDDIGTLLEKHFAFDQIIKLTGNGEQLNVLRKINEGHRSSTGQDVAVNQTQTEETIDVTETGMESLKISRIITNISNEAKNRGDFIMIYYAGHGMMHNSFGFWIPSTGQKEDPDNTSIEVGKVIRMLYNSKATSFIVADCCSSGAAADAANWTALQMNKEEKPIYILTSGRKFDNVRDGMPGTNSPFADVFMKVLLDSPAEINSNFKWLVGEIENRAKDKFKITYYDAGSTGEGRPFTLIKKNPISIKLLDAIPDLNFRDQHIYYMDYTPKSINLMYLKGTERCGHQLFFYHILKNLYEKGISFFEKPGLVKKIHSGESQNLLDGFNNIEQEIYNFLNDKNENEQSSAYNIYILLDKNSNNKKIYQAIIDLWKKCLTSYKVDNKLCVYLFIIDKRGSECSYNFIENDFETTENLTSLAIFPDIKLLTKKDIERWHGINKTKIQLKEFDEFPFEEFEENMQVEIAISKICAKYNSQNIVDILFNKIWI